MNSDVLPLQIDPLSCHTAIPKMLKTAGFEDVHVKTCYCCSKDKKVVFEVDAPNADVLAKALEKIDFPFVSIMEAQKK